jgi:16S rRNA (uracil1498-N3)-methyltransferase
MRQFFLAVDDLPAPGALVCLDAEESHHLLKVLRGGPDTVLNLVDGRGHRLTARPAGREGRLARVEILGVAADPGEAARPRLRLACGVVKGRRWEYALEKAVECGAHAVVPLLTTHGVVEPGGGRRERWLTILRTALKQSGRCLLPELAEPVGLGPFLEACDDGPLLYGAVPTERGGGDPSPTGPGAGDPAPPWLTVAVGPEGGWTPGERGALADAGACALDLGPHVLRTETAAVAALTVAQQWRRRWLGDEPGAAGTPA